jgi:hypothetical protein
MKFKISSTPNDFLQLKKFLSTIRFKEVRKRENENENDNPFEKTAKTYKSTRGRKLGENKLAKLIKVHKFPRSQKYSFDRKYFCSESYLL